MKRVLYLILFIGVNLIVHAQQNCFFTHYSSEDGLSQNTVMSILQDHKGTMWFATWDGLNKFNGYTFKTYKARQDNLISLTNNRIDKVYEDKYGYLWLLAYDNRAHRFDPVTETFEQVPVAGKEGSALNVQSIVTLPGGTVWLLTDNDGAIRVQTDPETHRLTTDIYSSGAGLFPARKVWNIHQDESGNEWLLTDNGLGMIRPGEKTPMLYFALQGKKEGVFRQAFYSVQELDKELIFGSDNGRLWRYLKKDGRFRLMELPTRARIVSVNSIGPGKFIAVTDVDGFFTCDLTSGGHTHYSHAGCRELPDATIRSAYVDRAFEVWFEQDELPGVVAHFNPATGVLKCERFGVEPTSTDRSRPAFHIHEDVNGYLWVHPYGGGFSYFDRENNRLIPFHNELGSRNWLFSNKLHSAFSDKQGNLWICSHSKGLEKVTFRSMQFNRMIPADHDYESLSNEVRALCEDSEHNTWVGLKDGMLRVYDEKRRYRGYLTEAGTISRSGMPLQGTVYFLMQDSKGMLWIATKGKGLVRAERISPDAYKLKRYLYNPDDIYSLSDDNVYCVYEDKKGRIWVATFGNGINYFSRDENGRDIFISHRNRLEGYPIHLCYKTRFITSDYDGRIWVGTTGGAVTFDENFRDPGDVRFYHYARVPNDTKSLSNNDVHWILPTEKKEIYLATFGGGLNKLVSIDQEGHGTFKSYSVLDGLSSDVLLSMREDANRNIWISTENGVCKFIPGEEKFETYDDKSIRFRVRFNEAASAFNSKGEIMFGASNGVFYFNPDSIRKSTYVPSIVFAQLVIANREVEPGESSLLKTGLDDTQELKLSHRENIFTIQYAALDYTNPGNIQYAYMLDGFDKQWTYADKQRNATYTNLPKGHYTFRVRSTNSDGVWVDNVRSLDIVVLPSFWETPFAYLLYVLAVLLIIFVAVYILFTIYRLKHEVSVEQQVSDIKLRFFTNISHELRTPLTLIAGPVEYVLQNTQLPAEAREQLVVVEKNTNRMLRLVNQILDFRKIQNKKMKMQVRCVDAVKFVRKIMDNFESLAEEHRIDFVLETGEEEQLLWIDTDKFEKIIFNLLSNAFKYTPNGKKITVFIRENGDTVSIGVQDQGIGIAENKKNSLFIRFENLVDKNLFNQASTGIGLSLVKELVEMHKAVITVDSRLGEGSCFTVGFLKGKEQYDETVEFILEDTATKALGEKDTAAEPFPDVDPEKNVICGYGSAASVATSSETLLSPEEEEDDRRPVMLLVEDNDELRFFLHTIFAQAYRVVEAMDGTDGRDKAFDHLPDIIISDVMMPRKDGIEMTRELRSDMRTSHIPIVLLTAKTSIESKLEGLEYGADDYITKPFSATYLKARVENLLSRRLKLQEFYRDHLMSIPSAGEQPEEPAPEMSPSDRKFMDKLTGLMEKNMDNGDLVVDDLVREVSVSRSVFFKKLKTLTGLAPIEFIKEMRINRAVRLIETGEYNMTQISYMVGINDPRYFSKCFKQKMGMTPTEYREKNMHP